MTDQSTALEELLSLSKNYSKRPDQVQGPGGNVSVKTSEGSMWIKASGFRFEELNRSDGVSAVFHSPISDYFRLVKPEDKTKEEKTMLELVGTQILKKDNGDLFPKPSMETGFHALLGNYVLHTHSVWSNLINCANNRTKLLETLEIPFKVAEIPFVSPGFGLSFLISETIKNANLKAQAIPDVFFLANHGIITHGDSIEKTNLILEQSDKAVRKALGLTDQYPLCDIEEIADNQWQPVSDFVSQQLKKHNCNPQFFDRVLFPDQTVFFKEQISDDISEPKKINLHQNKIIYRCNRREASSIHETMTAYLFIYNTLFECNLQPNYIGASEIDYINGMEMEKFRKGRMETE